MKNVPVRATQAQISLRALQNNLEILRKEIPTGTMICAAVKANAYGHGAIPIARTLRENRVEMLGVSSPYEAMELREAGDQGRMLLFSPTVPEEIIPSLQANLELMLTDWNYLENIQKAINKSLHPGNHPQTLPLKLHLKIDTGMGRVGFPPKDAVKAAKSIVMNPRLELAGVATHFPSADSDQPEDLAFTQNQLQQLQKIAGKIRREGIEPGIVHATNSGAIALHPSSALNMIRPGLALYGYSVASEMTPSSLRKLIPVMKLRARITALKRIPPGVCISYGRIWQSRESTWIATIPVGYADGYPRALSNKSSVLIGVQRYPVVGSVCMDQLMVNLGAETQVSIYDEVILFGPDSSGPDAAELAGLAGTISYEITCGISQRVPRVYL